MTVDIGIMSTVFSVHPHCTKCSFGAMRVNAIQKIAVGTQSVPEQNLIQSIPETQPEHNLFRNKIKRTAGITPTVKFKTENN